MANGRPSTRPLRRLAAQAGARRAAAWHAVARHAQCARPPQAASSGRGAWDAPAPTRGTLFPAWMGTPSALQARYDAHSCRNVKAGCRQARAPGWRTARRSSGWTGTARSARSCTAAGPCGCARAARTAPGWPAAPGGPRASVATPHITRRLPYSFLLMPLWQRAQL